MADSRIQIVTTDAGWHCRVKSLSQKLVWWTETYSSRDDALHAIVLLPGVAMVTVDDQGGHVALLGGDLVVSSLRIKIEVVDETQTPPAAVTVADADTTEEDVDEHHRD